MIRLKYSDGTTYDLSVADLQLGLVQDLIPWHTPYTHQVGATRTGLGIAKMTAKGTATSRTVAKWHDIVAVSLDSGTTYQVVYFSDVTFSDDQWSTLAPYTLTLLVSPVRESSVTRYPTTGYKWGDSSIANVSQLGNVAAYPTLYYLGPKAYWPLTVDLVDFAGLGVTFTRALAKLHAGISYAINQAIFDSGLYLASDTSTDTGKVTLPTSTLKTVACQVKQTRYPTTWSIGGTALNLLTANQSNIETDTTGLAGTGGTLTRDTVSPIAGTAHAKLLSTGSNDLVLSTSTTAATVTAGRWYCAQALVKCTVAAGRQVQIGIIWKTSGGVDISTTWKAAQACPTTATVLSLVALAPATAAQAFLTVKIVSSINAEVLYADSLMLEELPTTLTVWTATKNKLTIDPVNNLVQWTDDTTTIQATFPTADYMAGTLVDLVVIDDTSHAAVIACHAAGGSWTTGSGTLAAIEWPELTLGPLEGSLSNLIQYDYALTSAEYQAMDYTLEPLRFDNLFIINKYAGTMTKTSDRRLLTAASVDVSGLLSGADTEITTTARTVAMTTGLAARWYIEVKRTDTP